MKEPKHDDKEELPSAVDDAASVILESKRKEAFVRKNAPVEKKSPVRGLTVFVAVSLVLVALSAVLIFNL